MSLHLSASALAATAYTDEMSFLEQAGPLVFDSFEDLLATPGNPSAAIARTHYTMSSSIFPQPDPEGFGLYVFSSDAGFGAHATDGDVYVVHQSDESQTLRFDFATPVNSFGLSITDWDNPLIGADAMLVFGNENGDTFEILSGVHEDGQQVFFGVVDAAFSFSWVELLNTSNNEAYGIDGVYFSSPAPVPVPAAVWLFASALAGLGGIRRHRA